MNLNRRALGGLLAALAPAFSQSSGSLITYQGRLTDADGATVADGMYNVTFNIYEDSVSKFTQTLPVQVKHGVFTAFLGGSVALLTFDPEKSYEIGIGVGGTELSPRQKISSVPIAQVAATATSVQPGTVGTSQIVDGSVSVTKTTVVVGTLGVGPRRANGLRSASSTRVLCQGWCAQYSHRAPVATPHTRNASSC